MNQRDDDDDLNFLWDDRVNLPPRAATEASTTNLMQQFRFKETTPPSAYLSFAQKLQNGYVVPAEQSPVYYQQNSPFRPPQQLNQHPQQAYHSSSMQNVQRYSGYPPTHYSQVAPPLQPHYHQQPQYYHPPQQPQRYLQHFDHPSSSYPNPYQRQQPIPAPFVAVRPPQKNHKPKKKKRKEDSDDDDDGSEYESDFIVGDDNEPDEALVQEDEDPVEIVQTSTNLNMNPARNKKRRLVMSQQSDEEEEEESGNFDESSAGGDDDDADDPEREEESEENENLMVESLMKRCESISRELRAVLASHASHDSRDKLLTEETAKEMIGNDQLILKPYQIAGVNWISVLDNQDINAVLADEMGLGKTIQAVAFLRLLYKRDGKRGPHLIVAPASTIENWNREMKIWLPELKVVAYNGSQNDRAELRKNSRRNPESVDIWLTTYTYFERESCKDDRQFLYNLEFDVCIYDEAHAIKNTDSQRYQSLLQLVSRRRLLLTGTPCQNRLDELFALLSFCLPTIFSTRKSNLRKRIFGIESDPERVKRILSPFILRRLKNQVLSQLSPKTEEVIFLKMVPEQKELYDKVLKDFAAFTKSTEEEKKGKRKKNASSLATSESVFTELRKISNHPLLVKRRFGKEGRDLQVVGQELLRLGYFGKTATMKMVNEELDKYSDWDLNCCCLNFPQNAILSKMILPADDMFTSSSKAQKLRELVPVLVEKGHRILLFSQWTKLLDVFEELMGQIEVKFMRLDGSTPVDERQRLVDEYNGGLAPVFLLSTRAGGLGINLTSADVVILHDLDFNPTIDSQAMDRCHRIGQKKKVRVIKLVSQGSVDEAIYKMQCRKTGLNKTVLGEDGTSEVLLIEEEKDENENNVLLPSMKDFEEAVVDEIVKEEDQKVIIQNALKDAMANVQ